MLKKIIVASALALGFFVSFQVGNTGSGNASAKKTLKIELVGEAGACCQPGAEACCYRYPGCCDYSL